MAMKHNHENVALLLERACEQHAGRPALLHGERVISYEELRQLVRSAAGELSRRGVGAGDCVALWLPNAPAFVVAFHAALRLGATVAPFGVLLRAREVLERLAIARARLVVTTPGLAAAIGDVPVFPLSPAVTELADTARAVAPDARPAAAPAPDDVALLAFTSGTTGTPKAAEITQRGLAWNTAALAEAFALGVDDVQLAVAPLSHVLGMQGIMNATLTTGGALVLMERFEPGAALHLLGAAKVTGLMGAPAMFAALLREARGRTEPPRFRFAHGGGAPFPAELARAVAETFGCLVREGYGMSEVGGGISHTPLDRSPKAGSVGRAFPGSELRVVEATSGAPLSAGEKGEVQVRSPSVMRAYRGDAESTRTVLAPDGWLATGDIGYLDEDGDLFLVGRSKELIIRSGYNVYPREIEDVLLACPGVAEVAVLGVPHEERGEEIVALVVPTAAGLTPETVKAFAQQQLAAYKYPRHVLLVDALPKSPTGKLMKRDIDRTAVLARIREGGGS